MVPRIKALDMKTEEASQIKDSLLSVTKYLSSQEESLQWLDLIPSADAILELALLEGPTEGGYWFKAY
jgi:hypothetical protein